MTAKTIKITLKSEGASAYTNDVTDLVLGNMVSPQDGSFWSDAPAGNNPWTWDNDGEGNAHAFGIMGNYKYKGTEETALSKLVIDPTALVEGDGNWDVVAELSTAAIDGDKGNTLLRFKSVTVNGAVIPEAAYVDNWGNGSQPDSTFYS